MNKGWMGVAVLVFAGGVLAGWLIPRETTQGLSKPEPLVAASVDYQTDDTLNVGVVTQTVTVAVADTGTVSRLESEVDALLTEQGNLKQHATALEAELAQARAQLEKAEESQKPDRRRPRSREEYMHRLKEENPERYAEMQKRREAFRSRLEHGTAERATFFLDVNTENMTDEERENHENLLSLLGGSLQKLSGEMDGDSRHGLRHAMRDISQLYGFERDYILKQSFREMGFEDEDANAVAEYVEQVYDMTSMRGMFRGSRRRRAGDNDDSAERTSTAR